VAVIGSSVGVAADLDGAAVANDEELTVVDFMAPPQLS